MVRTRLWLVGVADVSANESADDHFVVFGKSHFFIVLFSVKEDRHENSVGHVGFLHYQSLAIGMGGVTQVKPQICFGATTEDSQES